MTQQTRPKDGEGPTVDMVVAVHDLRRDVVRAVSSILRDPDPSIRALVVCHNIDQAEVKIALTPVLSAHPGRVRLAELHDGVPSPSGPFNYGMAVSDAEYVGIMGSDDELDAGAIAQWRTRAERSRADAVIATVVLGESRSLVRSPPKRVWKAGVLHFSRDRLSYRSAPLGLIRREAIDRLGLRLLEGARNGGDLPFVTRLWATGRIVSAIGSAAYVGHDDAPVRVTMVAKPVREELESLVATLEDSVTLSLGRSDRVALATKLLRRNLSDSLRKRDHGRGLTEDDCAAMREAITRIDVYAPKARRMISVAQARALDELANSDPDLESVARWDAASSRYRTLLALLPADKRYLLHAQGQARFVVASALMKARASHSSGPGRRAPAAVGALGTITAAARKYLRSR